MFVSNEVVASVEATEAGFLADIIRAVQQRRPQAQAWFEPVAGGCAGYAGPNVPVNKVAGLGFGGVPDADRLAAIEARYHQESAPVMIELATHADPAIYAFLAERGYRLTGFEDVVGIELPAAEGFRAADVQLEVVAGDDARSAWLECLIDGFAAPDTQGVASSEDFPRDLLRDVMRDLSSVEHFTAWFARVDGELAGGGSLRANGSIAHLCGAATLPSFRRRGVQTTLVTERLQVAARAGSKLAITVTQPGSKSQQNMRRQGFELLYSRALLLLPPA